MLVVSEGLKTEVQYLEGLVQYLRSSGTAVRGVRAKGIGRDPLSVVRAAADLNSAEEDAYDEVWVVVDVDDHERLEEAIKEATERQLPMVITNPCFEVWLFWHYDDCTAHQTVQGICQRLAKQGHDGKRIPVRFPFHAHEAAAARASAAAVAPTVKGPNPSSSMPHLVAALQRRS